MRSRTRFRRAVARRPGVPRPARHRLWRRGAWEDHGSGVYQRTARRTGRAHRAESPGQIISAARAVVALLGGLATGGSAFGGQHGARKGQDWTAARDRGHPPGQSHAPPRRPSPSSTAAPSPSVPAPGAPGRGGVAPG